MEVGCTPPVVGNVLQNMTTSAKEDDVRDDWNHVDDDFRRRFYEQGSKSTAVFIA